MNKITISEVCNVTKGNIGITKAIPGSYPLVTTGAERLSHNEYQFNCKAVCVPLVSSTGHGHASIKRIHYQEGKFAIGNILAAITSKDENVLDSKYLYIYLSVLKDRILVPLMQGTANVSMSVKVIKKAMIDLPSIEKQKEIVETYQYILPIWESLDNLYKNQQSLINNMRESIIQLAVQGKLVPTEHDLSKIEGSTYEAADKILELIFEERCKEWEKKKKGKKLVEPKKPEVTGFSSLNEGWTYTFLESILSYDRSGMKTGPFGSLLKKYEHRAEGVPVFGIENVKNMKFVPGNKIYITKEKANQLSGYDVKPDDILISRSGTIDEICVVPKEVEDARFSTNLMRVTLHPNSMLPNFFVYFLVDLLCSRSSLSTCKGTTRKFLNQKILSSIVFPLPPLEEQKRIVTKVDQLMALCDQLEVKIRQAQSDSDILMEVAVSHLLEV